MLIIMISYAIEQHYVSYIQIKLVWYLLALSAVKLQMNTVKVMYM